MVKIISSNYGIASRCGDVISVNKRLNKYPGLKKAIIEHELNHSSKYNFDDLFMEFSISQLKGIKWDYYKFIITNPSSWTEYLPIIIENKKLKISPSMLLLWIFIIGFTYLLFKLL